VADAQTDLSVPAFRAAFEDNLLELLRAFGKLPGAGLLDTAELLRLATGLTSLMFNADGLARLDPAEADGSIEAMKAAFAERGAPAFWWVGVRSEAPDLGRRLEEHGFFDAYWAAMALDLERLEARSLAPNGVSVSRVRGGAEMRVWGETFCRAYGVPAFAGESCVEATEAFGHDAAPWSLYLVHLDGAPAGVSLAFVGPRVLGLLGIATIPEARRRGVGAALSVAPLPGVRAQGFRAAVLHSTETG